MKTNRYERGIELCGFHLKYEIKTNQFERGVKLRPCCLKYEFKSNRIERGIESFPLSLLGTGFIMDEEFKTRCHDHHLFVLRKTTITMPTILTNIPPNSPVDTHSTTIAHTLANTFLNIALNTLVNTPVNTPANTPANTHANIISPFTIEGNLVETTDNKINIIPYKKQNISFQFFIKKTANLKLFTIINSLSPNASNKLSEMTMTSFFKFL